MTALIFSNLLLEERVLNICESFGGMLTIEVAVANVGDWQLNVLLDPAIARLAEITSEGDYGAKDRIDLVIRLRGRVGLLRNREHRRILTDALKRNQAESLCEYLDEQTGDPWGRLRKLKFRKNSRKEQDLFDWFSVPDDEIPPEIEVEIPPTLQSILGSHSLFPHQRLAVRRVRDYLNSEQPRAFLHMPTGSGKTRTAMNHICSVLAEEEPRLVVWFAYNGELCEQAAREFERAWGHHGNREVEMQRMWGPHDVGEITDDGILFVGLDKLWAKHRKENTWLANLKDRVHLLVFDEAHQSTAETYRLMLEILLLNEDCNLLGMSATPGRTYSDVEEDLELSELYFRQKVPLEVEGYDSPLQYLVDEGYLSDPEFHEMTPPDEPLSDSDLDRVYGKEDYDDRLLNSLSESDERNLMILEKVRELINEGHRRILVFATNVRHSNILSAFMSMKWQIRCASITAETPPDMRQRWINDFVDDEDDEPCVLFNYGVLTTGFDAPKTSAAIIARPTKSLVLYSQMVGRIIRGEKVDGTKEAEIWTVVDQQLPGFRDISEAFWNWEDVW